MICGMSEIPGVRPLGVVAGAAAGMDRARAAGLPDVHLATLLAARTAASGQATGQPAGPWPTPVALAAALVHPAARLVDEVLVAACRRHLRQLGGRGA